MIPAPERFTAFELSNDTFSPASPTLDHDGDEGVDLLDLQSPLNAYELRVVYGLLAWIAYEQNVRQDVVQMVLEAEFGVEHPTQLRQTDYDAVVRYLTTLRLDVTH